MRYIYVVRHGYYLDNDVCSALPGVECTPPMFSVTPSIVGGERVQRAQGAVRHKDHTPSTPTLSPIRSTGMKTQCPK